MIVNEKMITLAREAAGLTQSALAHAVGISQARMSKIEHGFDEPNEQVLAAIADECEVLPELFVQEDPILGAGIVDYFHRKRLTLPAKPLRKAQAKVNATRLEVLRLMRTVELTDVAPFPSFPIEDYKSPDEVARMVRATWRVPAGPLPNLVELVESAGVPVVLTDLEHEKLSAISMPGLQGGHLIVLNAMLPASHRRFALAHELGHLVMHGESISEHIEDEANEFASALLMPAEDIRSYLRNIRFNDLGRLKPIWRVSLAALIRRAHDLGEITDRQYRTFNMRLNQMPGGRKREPGEFDAEQPRLIVHVIQHYQDDLGYTMEQVAKLMVSTEDALREKYLSEPRRTLRPVARGEGVVLSLPVGRSL